MTQHCPNPELPSWRLCFHRKLCKASVRKLTRGRLSPQGKCSLCYPGGRQRQPHHRQAGAGNPGVQKGAGLTFSCCERVTYGTGSRAWLCRVIWTIGPSMSARQSTAEARLAPAGEQSESQRSPGSAWPRSRLTGRCQPQKGSPTLRGPPRGPP